MKTGVNKKLHAGREDWKTVTLLGLSALPAEITRPHSVRERVHKAGFCEGPQAERATIADPAGKFLALIARPGQVQRGAQMIPRRTISLLRM